MNYKEINSHAGTHVLDGSNGLLRRIIPEMFDNDVDLLVEAGMSPKEIFTCLTKSCEKVGLVVSFVMKDDINRVCKSRQYLFCFRKLSC